MYIPNIISLLSLWVECLVILTFHCSEHELFIAINQPKKIVCVNILTFYCTTLENNNFFLVSDDSVCEACTQAYTFEGIGDNYCSADFGEEIKNHNQPIPDICMHFR